MRLKTRFARCLKRTARSTRVSIVTDRDTGQPRGFAFVEMTDDDAAGKAMEALNGTNLGGRNLTVNEARPKADRPRGGGGGGGRGGFGGGGGGRGGGGGGRGRSVAAVVVAAGAATSPLKLQQIMPERLRAAPAFLFASECMFVAVVTLIRWCGISSLRPMPGTADICHRVRRCWLAPSRRQAAAVGMNLPCAAARH